MIAHVPHLISLLHAIKKAWGDLQDLRGSVTPKYPEGLQVMPGWEVGEEEGVELQLAKSRGI